MDILLKILGAALLFLVIVLVLLLFYGGEEKQESHEVKKHGKSNWKLIGKILAFLATVGLIYFFWPETVPRFEDIESPSLATIGFYAQKLWFWLIVAGIIASAAIHFFATDHAGFYHKGVWGAIAFALLVGLWFTLDRPAPPAPPLAQCRDMGTETRSCTVGAAGTKAMKIESHTLGSMNVCNLPALPYKSWEESGTTYWRFWTTGEEQVEFKYKLFPVGTDCSQQTL